MRRPSWLTRSSGRMHWRVPLSHTPRRNRSQNVNGARSERRLRSRHHTRAHRVVCDMQPIRYRRRLQYQESSCRVGQVPRLETYERRMAVPSVQQAGCEVSARQWDITRRTTRWSTDIDGWVSLSRVSLETETLLVSCSQCGHVAESLSLALAKHAAQVHIRKKHGAKG